MTQLIRTTSIKDDFILLIKKLDAELALRDGDSHAFYNQFNKIDLIKHVVIAFKENLPVGCGALKEYDKDTMEVKRMYILPEHRGEGIALLILSDLEKWAKEMGYTNCILETGINQPEAIALYKKSHYTIIENYGQYKGVEASTCFRKGL